MILNGQPSWTPEDEIASELQDVSPPLPNVIISPHLLAYIRTLPAEPVMIPLSVVALLVRESYDAGLLDLFQVVKGTPGRVTDAYPGGRGREVGQLSFVQKIRDSAMSSPVAGEA